MIRKIEVDLVRVETANSPGWKSQKEKVLESNRIRQVR